MFQVTANWLLHNSSFSCTQKGLPLFNPALFGPFQDPGGGADLPPSFLLFPELLEGVTWSKMGSQLSSRRNLQFKTHIWCLGHFFPEIYLFKKKVFSYILALWGKFGTILEAFLTNLVILWPNGKFFVHEKWFPKYPTYIYRYTHLRGVGAVHQPPPPLPSGSNRIIANFLLIQPARWER